MDRTVVFKKAYRVRKKGKGTVNRATGVEWTLEQRKVKPEAPGYGENQKKSKGRRGKEAFAEGQRRQGLREVTSQWRPDASERVSRCERRTKG